MAEKRGRGRPKGAGGGTEVRTISMPIAVWEAIDEWRKGQPGLPTRSVSVKILLEDALGVKDESKLIQT